MKKILAAGMAASVLTLGLAGCGSKGPTCPKPVKLSDGSFTVAKMSSKCEKKLTHYAKAPKTNTKKK